VRSGKGKEEKEGRNRATSRGDKLPAIKFLIFLDKL
jgi:hypothetical protein